MAIGGVISNRNFGSFIGSGKGSQTGKAIACYRQECLVTALARSGHGKMFYRNTYVLKESRSMSRYSYCPFLRIIDPSGGKTLKPIARGQGENFLSFPQQFKGKFQSICPRKKTNGICECCVSPDIHYHTSVQTRTVNKLGINTDQCLQPERVKIRTRVDYKSEDYDVTEVDPSKSSEGLGEVVLVEGSLQKASPWWEQFPKRWVNMSIAILPMSKQFNWNSATVGLIQSSFFWGYLLTQILGGIWADKVGGKLVLGFGVVWWSIATVLTPIAAGVGLPFLLVMRAFMGIGEGVAMPAMNNIISKWIPVSERSRSLALVYSGMYLGSVTGLAFSPILIHNFGWPSVFYSFGSLGSIWFALWLSKAHSSPKEDPELTAEEKQLILGSSISKEPVSVIPWKLILSKPPVWALIISHFCHNWGTFILLTWMPTYYNQVLKFNLTESGLLCVLPWLTMAVFANIGGWIADTLVSKGLSITAVRKIMQSIGFLGPAFFLTQLSRVRTPALAVLCMACSQGSDAFSQSGLYSNHQDIGPRYAGVLLGLSNTAGVLAGVLGTAATGYILQRGSWDDVFKVAVALYIIGTLVWNFFSTGEKIIE
ncbi:ascorbate transporter, chloroplastic isoform X2 [Malania oleifera]|uniref:ascorbate transporter, chloroplastic isoform X2 n=1 Tax=Malania oleifera TaxID=397392 RepID=UPI0025ADBD4A|nr:ascorbate transporter, chloroplastic isoform X2 [Malania oleifera]